MTGVRGIWRGRFLLALLAALAPALSLVVAQTTGRFNERDVKRQTNVQDKDDIWVMDFRFKDPRLITVDIPGRGKRVVWYLWYQVVNPARFKLSDSSWSVLKAKGVPDEVITKLKPITDKFFQTDKEFLADLAKMLAPEELAQHKTVLLDHALNNGSEPRTFIPDFELVTQDKPGVFHDQVLPKVQEAIRRVEDPTGYLDIKNSVTIATQPIPVSKPEALPRAVTGVAMWDDIDPDANRYSIFVSGLSNGWSLDDKQVVRRKTLQLNFRRLGDRFLMDSRDIRFVPPAEWLYRASPLIVPDGTKPKEVEVKPVALPLPGKKPGAG